MAANSSSSWRRGYGNRFIVSVIICRYMDRTHPDIASKATVSRRSVSGTTSPLPAAGLRWRRDLGFSSSASSGNVAVSMFLGLAGRLDLVTGATGGGTTAGVGAVVVLGLALGLGRLGFTTGAAGEATGTMGGGSISAALGGNTKGASMACGTCGGGVSAPMDG